MKMKIKMKIKMKMKMMPTPEALALADTALKAREAENARVVLALVASLVSDATKSTSPCLTQYEEIERWAGRAANAARYANSEAAHPAAEFEVRRRAKAARKRFVAMLRRAPRPA